MENSVNNREFEQFVKQNANQYRMYPSEKVWKGIYSSLHTRRKWFVFGLILLALSATTVTWVIFSTPPTQKPTLTVPETTVNSLIKNENKPVSEIINLSIQTNKNADSRIPKLNNTQQGTSSTGIANIIPFALSEEINTAETEAGATSNSNNIFSVNTNPFEIHSESLTKTHGHISINDQATDNNPDFTRLMTGAITSENEVKKENRKDIYPLSIESVFNSYQAIAKKEISFQAYFAPSVSYRKLRGNNAILNSIAANNSLTNNVVSQYNVNKAVTHKPSIGLELGLSARYPIVKNIIAKAGFQFNVNRYDIKAFNYAREVATIALSQGSGISSVSTWTKYRNYNGYASNWLQNYYVSISTPIGADMIIAANKKAKFGMSGTVQPTYILHDRAYLITTDYKNYAEVPWLIRRWNVNTSLEAYINYSTGNIQWQVGPQIRYQLFSSFQNKYPVKENLYDFGLKVGIMLNQ